MLHRLTVMHHNWCCMQSTKECKDQVPAAVVAATEGYNAEKEHEEKKVDCQDAEPHEPSTSTTPGGFGLFCTSSNPFAALTSSKTASGFGGAFSGFSAAPNAEATGSETPCGKNVQS
jgi:hypothetical protein